MRLIDAELMNQICNHTSLSTWFPTSAALPNELEPVLITWVNRAPVSYYEEIKDETVDDASKDILNKLLKEYKHDLEVIEREAV